MGSIYSLPSPPPPLPGRQRQRPRPRGTTILTSGLGDTTPTAPLLGSTPIAPRETRMGTTILTQGMEIRTKGGNTPPPAQPQQPDPSQPDPCERIVDELKQVIKELFVIRRKIRETKSEIVWKQEEITRLESEPVDLPPLPLRLPRRPIKPRREFPSAANDIEQARRAPTYLDKLMKINNLKNQIRVLKQKLKILLGEEEQKERSERILANEFQKCEAGIRRP